MPIPTPDHLPTEVARSYMGPRETLANIFLDFCFRLRCPNFDQVSITLEKTKNAM